jgi:ectoine hydroxylase-related dioxygenase (phytanoyl-CoA dioxygenase family)
MYTVLRQPSDAVRIPLRDQHGRADLREAHVDFQPVHCTVTAYIDDVAPQGGGTVLYPRTHRLLHQADTRFTDLAGAQVLSPPTAEGVIRTELKPELKQIFDPISRAVKHMELNGLPEPVEFTGRAGDICIWHTRLFHRSCYNYSDRLRAALFYDVAKKSVDAQAYGKLRDHQKSHYHPEGMEGSLQAMEAYVQQQGVHHRAVAAKSMWDDWSFAVRSAAAGACTSKL